MNEALKKDLDSEEMTPMHTNLLTKVRSLVDMSRSQMSTHYCDWDKMQEAYDAKKDLTKQDRKSIGQGNPPKISVPLTYAQINTFVAFMFMMYHQRERFFELEVAGGPEDDKLREVTEKILQQDLSFNSFSLILYQFLLDVGKFGVGVFKVAWEVHKDTFLKDGEAESFDGIDHNTPKRFEEITTFEGNKLYNISPYKFYPDTRLPLTRFQEGEFCASEEEMPRHRLKSLEADGIVAGIDHVNKFSTDSVNKRSEVSRFTSIDIYDAKTQENNVCVTEVQVRLVPDQYELSDGTKLGNTSKPITFLVWMANDNRIIRLEPLNYYHGKFTYDVGQFSPDSHKQLSKSLTSQINDLQTLTDWFYNSRVEAVHRTLDNQLVVDPSVVDMSTVTNSSRVITLRRGAPKVGIDRFIKPLPVIDATTGHMNDVSVLSGMVETVTGINQTAQGQFHTGRRSATEARGAISGAASRMSLYGKLLWDGAIAPTGKKMVVNSRQAITQSTFELLVGEDQEQLAMYEAYKSNVFNLVRKSDFFVFDGTLPSEKQFAAQSLQELVGIIAGSPELAMSLNLDVNMMIKEIYKLRGLRNLSRFEKADTGIDPMMIQQILAQAGNAQQPQPTQ